MYGVTFVRDEELPAGYDWVLTRCRRTGTTHCFVKESAVRPRVIEEAWAAYRLMVRRLHVEAGCLPVAVGDVGL